VEQRRPKKTVCIILILGIYAGFINAARADSNLQFLPAGLVFPSFTHAIAVDAASMPLQAGSALQLEYAAPVGSAQNIYDGTYTHTTQDWGLGVGYNGWSNSGSLTHNVVIGGSVKVPSTRLSLGLSLESPFLNAAFSPTYNASAQIDIGSGVQMALVFYNLLNQLNMVGLGFGHREDGKYALEGGFFLPSPTTMFNSGSKYDVYLAGVIFIGSVGMSFNATFTNIMQGLQSLQSPNESLGFLYSPVDKFKLTLLWNNGGVFAVNQMIQMGTLTLGMAFEI